MTVGAVGTLQNSQCSVDLSQTTGTPSGNNPTLSLPVTFKPAYAGAKQVWMFAGGSEGSSGWQQRGSWRATASSAPVVTAVSVTPSTGSGPSGSSQTFSLLYSDTAGAADLTTAWMWFTPSFSGGANTCMLYYSRATNVLNLLNDAGTAWNSMTVGTAGTLQNSVSFRRGCVTAVEPA